MMQYALFAFVISACTFGSFIIGYHTAPEKLVPVTETIYEPARASAHCYGDQNQLLVTSNTPTIDHGGFLIILDQRQILHLYKRARCHVQWVD